jgi:hypothetical protein
MQEIVHIASEDIVHTAEVPCLDPTIHTYRLAPFVEQADDVRQ